MEFLFWFVVGMIGMAVWSMKQQSKPKDKPRDIPSPQPNHSLTKQPAQPSKNNTDKHIQIKGNIGEQLIKIKILENLNPSTYRHFHNLILPNQQKTTQIDHIIVSPFGIFVVEVKYFAGWIFGQSKDRQWTHTLSRHKQQKYPFPNPLHQNYGHIKALQNLLTLPETAFHSVVVFAHRNCQIHTQLPSNVCLLNNFIPYIQQYNTKMLNEKQMQAAVQLLSNPEFIGTEEKTQQHIQSLKK